ncbi:hypothetical protein OH540_09210 [Streptomyces sp. BPPL-273]|uniref:hypothetical protein n=1 Tax=Streptomyces sp. BPPL-273 TaxID=2987533 RepID=UPI0024AF7A32|nr:hypothetical protein [Streptomyces sp. BPPL-273]WHM30199.1 hypothetical protein OH540_09210 [Streptomyces sp. BPPL-273]
MNDYLPAVLAWLAAITGIVLVWRGRREDKPHPKPALVKTDQPQAAVIEIIEKGRATDNTTGGSVIIPNDVRINGQSLLAPRDSPVIVHEIKTDPDEILNVTLTLFARRVVIAAEDDL